MKHIAGRCICRICNIAFKDEFTEWINHNREVHNRKAITQQAKWRGDKWLPKWVMR